MATIYYTYLQCMPYKNNYLFNIRSGDGIIIRMYLLIMQCINLVTYVIAISFKNLRMFKYHPDCFVVAYERVIQIIKCELLYRHSKWLHNHNCG